MPRKSAPKKAASSKTAAPPKTGNGDKLSDAPMQVTQHRVDPAPEAAVAPPVPNGPSMGYLDTGEGPIQRHTFSSGDLPEGWVDTPASCERAWRDVGIKKADAP